MSDAVGVVGAVLVTTLTVAALVDQEPEAVQVHQVRVDVQHVAGMPPVDPHRHTAVQR